MAEQDCLGFPFITMEQAPHTSSKQFISQATGVVFFPSAVTGFRRISIKAEITFMLADMELQKSPYMGESPDDLVLL